MRSTDLRCVIIGDKETKITPVSFTHIWRKTRLRELSYRIFDFVRVFVRIFQMIYFYFLTNFWIFFCTKFYHSMPFNDFFVNSHPSTTCPHFLNVDFHNRRNVSISTVKVDYWLKWDTIIFTLNDFLGPQLGRYKSTIRRWALKCQDMERNGIENENVECFLMPRN